MELLTELLVLLSAAGLGLFKLFLYAFGALHLVILLWCLFHGPEEPRT